MKIKYKVREPLEIVINTLPGILLEVKNKEEWIGIGTKLIKSIDQKHRPGYMHKHWFEEVGFDLEENGCFPCYVAIHLYYSNDYYVDINWGDVAAIKVDNFAEVSYSEFIISKLSFSED